MKFTIKLATKSTFQGQVFQNPFWFTRDRSIHLSIANDQTKEMEIDTDKISKENLIQIYNGIIARDITCNIETEEILKLIENTEKSAYTTIQRTAEDIRSAQDVKKAVDQNLIESTLQKSFGDIKKILETEDAFNDITLLQKLLEAESADKKRSSLLKLIQQKIEKLSEDAVIVAGEVLEVEETEDKKIIYDAETQTLNDLEENQQQM